MLGTERAVNCQLRSLLAASIVAKVRLGDNIGDSKWDTVWKVWAVPVQNPQEPKCHMIELVDYKVQEIWASG